MCVINATTVETNIFKVPAGLRTGQRRGTAGGGGFVTQQGQHYGPIENRARKAKSTQQVHKKKYFIGLTPRHEDGEVLYCSNIVFVLENEFVYMSMIAAYIYRSVAFTCVQTDVIDGDNRTGILPPGSHLSLQPYIQTQSDRFD